MSIPKTGGLAPDFTLPADDDKPLTLSSLRGKPVVLFFYPKDDTTGCTKEACSFRDALPRFEKMNATIIGISPDSTKSHRKFKEKYDLPYTTGSFPVQYAKSWRTIAKLSLPDKYLTDTADNAPETASEARFKTHAEERLVSTVDPVTGRRKGLRTAIARVRLSTPALAAL